MSQAPLGDHQPGDRARSSPPPGRPATPVGESRPLFPPRSARREYPGGARPVRPRCQPLARLTRDACRDPLRSPAVGASALCARGPRSRLSPKGRGPGAAPPAAAPARPERCARAQDGCGHRPRPGTPSASHSPRPRGAPEGLADPVGDVFCLLHAPLPLSEVRTVSFSYLSLCPWRRTLPNLVQLIAHVSCETPSSTANRGETRKCQ